MKADEQPQKVTKTALAQGEKIDRRDFMLKAGKVALPTLGILGLQLLAGPSRVAAGCEDTCSGGCSTTCSGCFGCTGSCAGECDKTCRDICANSCTVGCSSSSS